MLAVARIDVKGNRSPSLRPRFVHRILRLQIGQHIVCQARVRQMSTMPTVVNVFPRVCRSIRDKFEMLPSLFRPGTPGDNTVHCPDEPHPGQLHMLKKAISVLAFHSIGILGRRDGHCRAHASGPTSGLDVHPAALQRRGPLMVLTLALAPPGSTRIPCPDPGEPLGCRRSLEILCHSSAG